MIHRIVLTGLTAAFASAAGIAFAQIPGAANTPPAAATAIDAQPPASQPDQTIIVEAPRQVKTPRSAEPFAGEGFMATTVKIPVLYSDLDLTRDDDARRLMNRVDRVARDACAELDRVYPLDPDADCVSRAEISGHKAAQVAIDAARGAE